MKKWLSLTVMTCILLGAAYLAIATEQGRKSVQSLENVQLALQDVEQRIAKYGATDELLQKRAAYVEALAQLNEQAGVSAPVETVAPAAPVAAAEAVVIPDPVKDNAYYAAQRTGNENDAMVNYYRMLWDRYESGADLTPAEKQDLYDSGMLDEGRYEEGGAIDAAGGPDGFGYRYVDNTGGDTATFAWIDIVGAPGAVELVDIRNADDTDDTLTLSFNFPFYGVNRTTVYPSANGAIGMAPTASLNFSNSCTLPNTDVAFSTGAIFPFWDDQHTQTGGLGGVYASDSGSVWYKDEGDRVIIQWDSVGRFSGAAGYAYSYQAILYSDGKIKFQYLDLARTAANLPSATIAIQQGSTAPNNNFLIYSCNTLGNAAQDTIQNRAVWFYTSPFAVNDFSTSAVVAPVSPYRVEAGAAFNVVARFRNAGTATQSSPVKYTFNGGPVVSENTASLAQFATEDHDFTGTETAPSVPGSYSLTFYSDLLTDTDRSNDTLRVNVIVYEGRCCYNNGNSCLDTTAAYCTTVAGLFDTTKTCAANPCPIILNGGDLCADAVALNVGQQVNGSLVGSTPETGLPACGSGYNSTSNGRWYTVVGTGNTMTANMCDAGTNYDSEVFVFCGSCAGLTCIGGDDDGCTSPAPEAASIFSWCSVSGTTYYVLATSFSTTGNAGSYSLFISDNGTTCANPIDCNPTGRCCYLDVNGDPQCVDNLSAECAALGGTWNDALSCATTPCEIGRCCYLLGGAGACEDNTLLECNALAGTWTDAADCATTPCAVGRCCYLDNGVAACADVIQLECTFLGGTWVDALDCATTPCEIGRCCYDDNGTTLCTDNTVLECNALAGSWNDALDCATSACPVILQGADLCANAVLVTVGQSVAGTLAGSTPETGIPTCGSGYSTTSNGVWYTVVGTGNTMTASMCDPITNYDSELFVFCGSCDGLVCVGGDDDGCILRHRLHGHVVLRRWQ
ncbi:MAG: hypothetical protein IPH10_09235 [bacterium]|nr:hypothetical protein [bacterium]